MYCSRLIPAAGSEDVFGDAESANLHTVHAARWYIVRLRVSGPHRQQDSSNARGFLGPFEERVNASRCNVWRVGESSGHVVTYGAPPPSSLKPSTRAPLKQERNRPDKNPNKMKVTDTLRRASRSIPSQGAQAGFRTHSTHHHTHPYHSAQSSTPKLGRQLPGLRKLNYCSFPAYSRP